MPGEVEAVEQILDRAAEERMRVLLQDQRPGEPVQTISHRSVAEEIVSKIAPPIRSQERQRVREGAKAFFAQELETAEAVGSRAEVDRTRSLCKGLLAALDEVEDGDV